MARYFSEEHRARISESKKRNWADPDFKSKMKHLHSNPEAKAKLSQAGKKRWSNPDAAPRKTIIGKTEWIVKQMLDVLKIEYIHQYSPQDCRWVYDFYLPSYNMLLEIDDFTHSNQAFKIARDLEKDTWATEHGYLIGRLWDGDVMSMDSSVLRDELQCI